MSTRAEVVVLAFVLVVVPASVLPRFYLEWQEADEMSARFDGELP